jgi:iron(III) transport system permease protein
MTSASRSTGPASGPGWTTTRWLAGGLVSVLILLPLGMLIWGAMSSAAPGDNGGWSLQAIRTAYSTSATAEALRNSLILGVSSTVIASGLGLVFAFVSARTTVPGRQLLTPAMALLVALPPLLYGLSWSLLGAPHIGLIAKVPFLGGFNVNSWPGLILVVSLKSTAFAYLLLIGPVRRFDMTVLESARVCGGSPVVTLTRVAVPLLLSPLLAAAILSFVVSFAIFDIPQIIGFPAGIKVYSTRLFSLLATGAEPDYNGASALALALVLLLVVLAAAHKRVTHGLDATTVAGKGFNAAPWRLGRSRWVLSLLVIVFVTLAVVAPLTQLVLGSLQPVFGVYGTYTGTNFDAVLRDPQTFRSLWVTLRTAVASGLIAMVLAFAVAYLAARRRDRLSRALLSSMWLPWAMPGIVLALGITWAVVQIGPLSSLYGSNLLVLAGLVVVALPVASRAAEAAVAQLAPQLEEAGRTCGATSAQTFRSIVLRLVLPSFAAGWFLCIILAAGILDLPLVLAGRADPPFPVVLYSMYQTGQTAQAAAACVVALAMAAAFAAVAVIARSLLAALARRRPLPAHGAPRAAQHDPEPIRLRLGNVDQNRDLRVRG